MTDQEQAARIAAMRARRGQTPVNLQVTQPAAPIADASAITSTPVSPATASAPAGTWAPPAATGSIPPPPPVSVAAASTATAAAVAPTGRTNGPKASKGPKAPKTKHPHVAAGARILVTGVTASAVFGLTTVIAAASHQYTDSSAPTGTVTSGTDASGNTVATAGTDATGSTVALTVPKPGKPTVVSAVSTDAKGNKVVKTVTVDAKGNQVLATVTTDAKGNKTVTTVALKPGVTVPGISIPPATTVKPATPGAKPPTTAKPVTPTTQKASGGTPTTKPVTPTTQKASGGTPTTAPKTTTAPTPAPTPPPTAAPTTAPKPTTPPTTAAPKPTTPPTTAATCTASAHKAGKC